MKGEVKYYIDRIIIHGSCIPAHVPCIKYPLSFYCDAMNNKGDGSLSTTLILSVASKVKDNNYDVASTLFDLML